MRYQYHWANYYHKHRALCISFFLFYTGKASCIAFNCFHFAQNWHLKKLLFCFQLPSINQETGIAGPELNETLKKMRSDTVLRPNHKQKGKVRTKSETGIRVCIYSFGKIFHNKDLFTFFFWYDLPDFLWPEFGLEEHSSWREGENHKSGR